MATFPRIRQGAQQLAQALSPNPQMRLTPSVGRSALVQQLLAKAAQPRGSGSLIESLNIASKPILAALLARREEAAQREQNRFQGQNRAAMAAALQRINDPNTSPELREATNNALSRFISVAPGDDPVAMAAIQQQIAPQSQERDIREGRPGEFIDFTNPDNPVTLREPSTPSSGDQREREIDDLMAQGLTRAESVNVVDGNARLQLSDDGSRVVLLDEVTQSAREIPMGNRARPEDIPSPDPGRTLWDQSDDATGPVSAGAAALSVLSGAFGGPVADETIQSRQAFRLQAQNFTRALAINPRFPVAEQERIREEISTLPRVFDAPEAMRQRMKAIDEGLRIRLDQADRDASDPSLPEDVRTAQATNASAIRNFLPILGVPEADRIGAEAVPVAEGVPEGVDPALWAVMTPEEQALWQTQN